MYHLWYTIVVLRKRAEKPLSGQKRLVDSAGQVKRVPVIFFRTEAGGEPVRDWLKGLPSDDRQRIGEDIKTVEFGWPLGMPLCRPLGDGVYEVRSSLLQNRIARVLFYVDRKGRMVLLHGFIKKTRKTPDEELRLARNKKSKHERGLS
jgi:phage-related protein